MLIAKGFGSHLYNSLTMTTTTNHERGRRWYRYAVYANRLLVLVTADRLEAEVRYSQCKMDETCMRVTLCGVKRGQAVPQTLAD